MCLDSGESGGFQQNSVRKMLRLLWCLLGLFVCMQTCNAFKVLVVFPLPGRSHGILGSAIVKHLLNYGYEVTYITPFIEETPHPNLHQVDVSANLKMIPKDTLNINSVMNKEMFLENHKNIMLFTNILSTKTLENENVQKLLNDPKQHFDLIIIEWLFDELLTGLSAIYEAPFVFAASVEPHWIITRLIDEALNPSYNSDTFSNNMPPFTFCQRVEELWTQIKVLFYMYTQNDDTERKEYERLVAPIIRKRGRQPPSFDDVKYNASLVLGNSHVSLGQATKVPQAYKSVGGYHVDEEVKPLPQNIQKIMDNAKEGVIFFSMGSQLKSKDLADGVKNNLLKVFGSLKQTVLWKFEDDSVVLPKNVHVLKWAPQQSILAHPNCVLFINHGGLLSTTEAIHFGVPIIGIPVFGDQFVNVDRAVGKGFALKVKLTHSLADDLKAGIQELLNNKRYSEIAKSLSIAYHHRPVKPSVELIHWVEHVIITRGAPHLKSHGMLVPWYQKLYLDLMAIIVGLLVVVVTVFKRIFSLIFSKKNIDGKLKKN